MKNNRSLRSVNGMQPYVAPQMKAVCVNVQRVLCSSPEVKEYIKGSHTEDVDMSEGA